MQKVYGDVTTYNLLVQTVLLVASFKLYNVEPITQLWDRLFLADSGMGGEACPATGFHSEQRRGGTLEPPVESTHAHSTEALRPRVKCDSFWPLPVHTDSTLNLEPRMGPTCRLKD